MHGIHSAVPERAQDTEEVADLIGTMSALPDERHVASPQWSFHYDRQSHLVYSCTNSTGATKTLTGTRTLCRTL